MKSLSQGPTNNLQRLKDKVKKMWKVEGIIIIKHKSDDFESQQLSHIMNSNRRKLVNFGQYL
jgi:hypothetical protein